MSAGSLQVHDLKTLGIRLVDRQRAMLDVGEFYAMVPLNVPDPRATFLEGLGAVVWKDDGEGVPRPVVVPGLALVHQYEGDDLVSIEDDVTREFGAQWRAFPSLLGIHLVPWSWAWQHPADRQSIVPTPHRIWDLWPLDLYEAGELEAAWAQGWERARFTEAEDYWRMELRYDPGGYDPWGTPSFELEERRERLFPGWVDEEGRNRGLYLPDVLAPLLDIDLGCEELDAQWKTLSQLSRRNWQAARSTVRPDRRVTWDYLERNLNPWYCS